MQAAPVPLPVPLPIVREYDDHTFDNERDAVGWAYGLCDYGWKVSSITPLTTGAFVAFVYRDNGYPGRDRAFRKNRNSRFCR